MTDPIADILGDYRAFFARQKDRLRDAGSRSRRIR